MKTLYKWIWIFSSVSSLFLQASPAVREGMDWAGISSLAIQERGRVKPFDTFARESVQYVTGKQGWKQMSPVEVIFSWLIAFEREWQDEPFIRIDYGPLKKLMNVPTEQKYFTLQSLSENEGLRKVIGDAAQKEQTKERLNELEKKAVEVRNQIGIVEAVVRGEALTILPNPAGMNEPWFALSALIDANHENLPYPPEKKELLSKYLKGLLNSYLNKDAVGWTTAVPPLVDLIRGDLAAGNYPQTIVLDRERFYNALRPFRIAWILYALAFVILLVFNVTKSPIARFAGLGALFAAFSIHAFGFGLRCMIAGRPPVTNMYESIIWVTWGCVLFSLIILAAYKNAIIPTAASVFAIVGLVLADYLPAVLDPSIQPLEPVLRSNFWLTIHVLTITLSYAAFALSLCLGNVVLGNFLFRPKETAWIQLLSLYMYRAMQIGVVLLAAGTILGGVWADYSWGRFWGWDPKEVWALTALLLYLAVLHGRFSGWLKGFGFVAATVVSFLGVLMAWYGVNFVLGVGLHSYGFGTGGMSYVLTYLVAQIAFIVAAYFSMAKERGTDERNIPIFPPKPR